MQESPVVFASLGRCEHDGASSPASGSIGQEKYNFKSYILRCNNSFMLHSNSPIKWATHPILCQISSCKKEVQCVHEQECTPAHAHTAGVLLAGM